jgi:hypothetical protein
LTSYINRALRQHLEAIEAAQAVAHPAHKKPKAKG